MNNDGNTKTRPTRRVYSVTKNGDSRANWQEIGAAWPHKDGQGFNLKFTARPLGGAESVLREPKPAKGALNERLIRAAVSGLATNRCSKPHPPLPSSLRNVDAQKSVLW